MVTNYFNFGQDKKGVVGLILNRPMEMPSLRNLLIELKLPAIIPQASSPIYFGGPVDASRGFIIHTSDYKGPETLEIFAEGQGFFLTSHTDILAHISEGRGPTSFLGDTGWDRSQLEQELLENTWLLIDGKKDFIFAKEPSSQWKNIYRSLKIDPDCLFTTSRRS